VLLLCLQDRDPPAQSLLAIESVVHENYVPKGDNDFDIAVIELPKPLTFNDYVQPVCLPSTPVAAGTKCVVTGWGFTEYDGKQEAQLLLGDRATRKHAKDI